MINVENHCWSIRQKEGLKLNRLIEDLMSKFIHFDASCKSFM